VATTAAVAGGNLSKSPDCGSASSRFLDNPSRTEIDMDDKDKDEGDKEAVSGTTKSTLGGAVAGAVAGTALGAPVVGTVLGAVTGAAIGAAKKRTRGAKPASAATRRRSPKKRAAAATKRRSPKRKTATKKPARKGRGTSTKSRRTVAQRARRKSTRASGS
jgi:Bacteriocin class II with double-glycine leader peptide